MLKIAHAIECPAALEMNRAPLTPRQQTGHRRSIESSTALSVALDRLIDRVRQELKAEAALKGALGSPGQEGSVAERYRV